MTEPRALPRARPPLISPLGAAVKIKIKTKKRRKECGCHDHPPNEQYLGSGGEENRSSTSHGPSSGRGGGIERPLVCSPCTKVMSGPLKGLLQTLPVLTGSHAKSFKTTHT